MSIQILHVLPSLEYSGSARVALMLAEHLPQGDFSQQIVALERRGTLERQFEQRGRKVASLADGLRPALALAWQLRKHLKRERNIAVILTYDSATQSVALLAARGTKVRQVLHLVEESASVNWKARLLSRLSQA
ncbi:MAG: glycosyltransferase, partial [Planctomycetota bacterium]|nr:glycosyltransferase [Planctomycetota bacterium]